MRHKEPVELGQYKENNWIYPKICHTCHNYKKDGVCSEFGEEPPEDFALQDEACPSWEDEIPF
mgnify:CR=1 FL=1